MVQRACHVHRELTPLLQDLSYVYLVKVVTTLHEMDLYFVYLVLKVNINLYLDNLNVYIVNQVLFKAELELLVVKLALLGIFAHTMTLILQKHVHQVHILRVVP